MCPGQQCNGWVGFIFTSAIGYIQAIRKNALKKENCFWSHFFVIIFVVFENIRLSFLGIRMIRQSNREKVDISNDYVNQNCHFLLSFFPSQVHLSYNHVNQNCYSFCNLFRQFPCHCPSQCPYWCLSILLVSELKVNFLTCSPPHRHEGEQPLWRTGPSRWRCSSCREGWRQGSRWGGWQEGLQALLREGRGAK